MPESQDTAAFNATVKVNLAVQHLLGAARFSREVARLEKAHEGSEFADFWEGIFHNAVACVLTATASLEAYANELFSEKEQVFSDYSKDLLHDLWISYERKPVLDKFKFALLLLERPAFQVGAQPFQDIDCLIDLRNALIHFKPEWMKEAAEHTKLSKKLAGKFQSSVYVTDTLLFPRKWACHSCTSWAVSKVLAFARTFESMSGLPEKFKIGDPVLLKP